MSRITFLDKIGATLGLTTKIDAANINELKHSVNEMYDSFDLVSTQVNSINSLNLWIPKDAQSNKAAIVAAYPTPALNWAAMALDDGYIYVNDGLGNTIEHWINSGQKAFPTDVVTKDIQPVYNVTTNIPLESGSYYTLATATAAVPENIRKYGLILIYEIRSKVWEQIQFTGVGNNLIFEWSLPQRWDRADNMFIDITFQVGRTFSDIYDARNNAPMKSRRTGVIFQYELNDSNIITERYTGDANYLESDAWYASEDFKTVYVDGTVSSLQKESLILSQYYINGTFNASVYSESIGGSFILVDSVSARNIIPSSFRKNGLILAYYASVVHGVATPQICIEQFIGTDITNPSFYEDDSQWIFVENESSIKSLADERILYNSTLNAPDIEGIQFIVPDKLYFVKDRKLPFYRDSMFLDSNKDRLSKWEISINTITSKLEGLCNTFNESINLNGNDIGTLIDLSIRKNGVTWPYYGKLIYCNITDAATKVESTPKCLLIGDSITNRYIPKLVKDILSSCGISPTMVGTIENLGGEHGEGKEGWTISNLIGWENVHGSISDGNTISPSNSTSTTIYQNPFLKLANSSDKTYYPDYCFRSTGSIKELSYAEDSDKSGDFYIFSFSKYVTTNLSGAVPNIVTIALGTNDSNKGYGLVYPDVTTPELLNDRYWKCLDFIITNIIENYPFIEIGIVPMYSRFDNYQWVDGSYAVGLIQSTIKNIRDKSNSSINVVGVWNNINRYYCSNGKERVSLDSNIGVDTVISNGDTLHYDHIGQQEIANSLSSYIINVIT